MEFEELFQYIGDVGLYQILLYFSVGIINFINGIQAMIPNFYSPFVDHWCQITRLQNFSFDTQRLVAIPYKDGDPGQYDMCEMFDLDYNNLTEYDILTWDREAMGNMTTIDCPSGYVYDQSEFVSTIISKFELVCSRSWMAELTSSIYMFGRLIGSLVSASLADRLGRRYPMLVAVVGYFIAALLQAFAPNYTAFVIFRFLCAAFNTMALLSSFTLIMELIGPKVSVLLGTMIQNFFSIGIMAVSGIAYFIRSERNLFIASSIPLLALFPFIWIVPESPRWQISKGKFEQAEKTLRYIAKVNNKQFPENVIWTQNENMDPNKEQNKGSCSDFCKSPILCGELALMYFNWFTVALVYYGVSFNAGSFGDVFLNTLLLGLVELPANTLCWILLQRTGRRWPNGTSLLFAGLFCLICVPVILTRPDMQGLLTALSTVGKGGVTFAFTSIYVYSAELFPTPVRQMALGSSSMIARIGSMASPFLGRSLEDIWQPMPSVIFGALAGLTGCVVFLLPETKGNPLPDTIQEAENIARKKKKAKLEPDLTADVPTKETISKTDLVTTKSELVTTKGKGYVNKSYITDNRNISHKRDDDIAVITRL